MGTEEGQPMSRLFSFDRCWGWHGRWCGVALWAAIFAPGAWAQGQPPSDNAALPLLRQVPDGAGPRKTIRLDPTRVAHIGPDGAVVMGVAPGVEQARTADATVADGGSHNAAAVDIGMAVSVAVYREGDSPVGRLMALPGGVIVQLAPEWSDAQVQVWATTLGLSLRQRLALPGQWHVVDTPPGEAALALAYRLEGSPGVSSVRPNWWRHTTKR
jgi:hypothetical protein